MVSDSILNEKIGKIVKEHPLVLFMKGDAHAPACGYSAGVVEILNQLGQKFEAINILVDDNLRSFMKVFSNWPTYPQLYYKGEFIGGYDIIVEMFENGELAKLFEFD